MDNKRLTSNIFNYNNDRCSKYGILSLFILLIIIGACSRNTAQIPTMIPKFVTTTATNQIQIHVGSGVFALRELTGFTITGSTISPPTAVDGSITNEGQMSFTGNSTNGSVVVNTNTSGSAGIKVIGKSATTVTRGADTLYITTPFSTGNFLQPSTSTTVNNGTLTNLPNMTIEIEEGGHVAFTTYLHYTTGATSQGVQFRITTGDPTQGTYWFDYDFPITGGHQTGSIYNANTTISTPSSESGTNIAIIRGIVKSNNTGILDLIFQVAAEDGSSTITVLTTSVTKLY